VKTKNVMISALPPKSNPAGGTRAPEALFYSLTGLALLLWALTLAADLTPQFINGSKLQTVLVHNSGHSTLIFALAILSGVAFFGALSALRSRSLPSPSASILLITVAALRTLEILTDGSVSLSDANLLGGLFAAAAFLYYGPVRLWWFLLMPLAVLASFSPLVWLEFYKGASVSTLLKALWLPAGAFATGSVLILMRELRARATANVLNLKVLRLRGDNTMAAMRAMEADLKQLRSILSGEATEVTGLETTEFTTPSPLQSNEPSEATSVDEIDAAARRLLEEARVAVEGRPVKLVLTAPVGTGLPIAVRGSILSITSWMKSSILNSIESLGGFPDGTVRVSIRPGLTALQILIEDNGRGFGESILSKMGQASDRVSVNEIRKGVERLGGRFDIQARLGVGSRLVIELPRVDALANSPRISRGLNQPSPSSVGQQLH